MGVRVIVRVVMAMRRVVVVLMAVVKSFDTFPADGNFLQALGQMRLHELGASLFSSALWIALPMIALRCL